jgi:hypothetical protein
VTTGESTTGSSTTGGSGTPEVSDPAIIDNFSSCDGVISRVEGRDGVWFTFGDNGVNVAPAGAVGAQPAPSGFGDQQSCAAWYTTGCVAGETQCNFAGLGFTFRSDESPVSLSGYSGFSLRKEGDEQWVVVHNPGARAFGATLPAGEGTVALYFSDFVPSGDTPISAVPDWTQVSKVEFTTTAPAGSGFAIWDIRLF